METRRKNTLSFDIAATLVGRHVRGRAASGRYGVLGEHSTWHRRHVRHYFPSGHNDIHPINLD
jgi:hypothetical protein